MSVLSKVRTGRQPKPPKIVVYGPPKIGKSTFGAGIPEAIFLTTEEGIDALDVASFPKANSFQEVLSYIGALAKEEHGFRALVLDSLDWLEPLIWAEVCREQNSTSIELVGGGYGKGYVEATKQWRRLLDGLDYLREHRSMTVVLIGHDEIRRMEPPDSEPYDYAALKLHKRAAAIITEWADIIGYAHLRRVLKATDTGFGNKHVRAMSTDEHELVVGANPAYVSGSRYAIPDVLPLSWEALRSALAEALRPQPDAE